MISVNTNSKYISHFKTINTMETMARKKQDFSFICEILQRGRKRPAKYIHSITMPVELFREMQDGGAINIEDYYIDESMFLEYKDNEIFLSFVCLYACEDMHRRIDCYLIVKLLGFYPIKRTGVSKMNFDRIKPSKKYLINE